jgi:hypothetical protein
MVTPPKGVRPVVLAMHSPRPEVNDQFNRGPRPPPIHFLESSEEEFVTP